VLGGLQDFCLEKQVVYESDNLRHAVYLALRCIMRRAGQQARQTVQKLERGEENAVNR